MSSFLVSNECLNLVVMAALECSKTRWDHRKVTTFERNELGNRLFDLNVAALNERYGADATDMVRNSGYQHLGWDHLSSQHMKSKRLPALKAIRCLIYQCCEGDVADSPGYQFLEDLADEYVLRILVMELESDPKYRDAPWG
jgi:hypothetical protein